MIKNIIKGDTLFPLGNPHRKNIKCYPPGIEGFLVLYPHSFTSDYDEKKVITWGLFNYFLKVVNHTVLYCWR